MENELSICPTYKINVVSNDNNLSTQLLVKEESSQTLSLLGLSHMAGNMENLQGKM